MAVFIQKTFFQPVLDIDGEQAKDYVNPTQKEAEIQAKEKGFVSKKEIPMTFKYAIREALRTDFSEMSAQGRIPDPHEGEKAKLFELLVKVNGITDVEADIELEESEIEMIRKRLEKKWVTEIFGYVNLFLRQKLN